MRVRICLPYLENFVLKDSRIILRENCISISNFSIYSKAMVVLTFYTHLYPLEWQFPQMDRTWQGLWEAQDFVFLIISSCVSSTLRSKKLRKRKRMAVRTGWQFRAFDTFNATTILWYILRLTYQWNWRNTLSIYRMASPHRLSYMGG